jgi:membrane protein
MDSLVARIIGVTTLIFSATTVFIALQSSLNKVWNIKLKANMNWIKYIVNRLLSFALVVSFGFVLLVSLLVDAFLVAFQNRIANYFSEVTPYLIATANLIFSLGVVTLIFALIFKVLPDAKIRWRDVWVGAFITTLLFTAGKYLIGLYLGSSTISSAYGAAGSLVVILVWIYYSTVIFLFGAEFTYVHACEFGGKIVPYAHAIKFKIVDVPPGE